MTIDIGTIFWGVGLGVFAGNLGALVLFEIFRRVTSR